jgi:uncharacterized membrane protein YgdD (TMEM256/DUF423 family)
LYSFSAAVVQQSRAKGSLRMTLAILLVLAGLMGAGGVMLAAAGAHAAPGAGLDSAAYMLLFHATAIIGATALIQQGVLWRPLTVLVLAAWVVGAVLFSGDIALRAFAGHRLFPMAAPSGGIILILAWLGFAVAAIGALVRG